MSGVLVWRHYGLTGLVRYARRLTMWWMPLAWWVFIVIGNPRPVLPQCSHQGIDHRSCAEPSLLAVGTRTFITRSLSVWEHHQWPGRVRGTCRSGRLG